MRDCENRWIVCSSSTYPPRRCGVWPTGWIERLVTRPRTNIVTGARGFFASIYRASINPSVRQQRQQWCWLLQRHYSGGAVLHPSVLTSKHVLSTPITVTSSFSISYTQLKYMFVRHFAYEEEDLARHRIQLVVDSSLGPVASQQFRSGKISNSCTKTATTGDPWPHICSRRVSADTRRGGHAAVRRTPLPTGGKRGNTECIVHRRARGDFGSVSNTNK